MTDQLSIHESWADVMADVAGVAKRDVNRDQGFSFRGIDAVLNAVGPALRKHGVFIIPTSIEIIDDERYTTKRGASMRGVMIRVEWTVSNRAGGSFNGVTLGQAADSGDKVITKAQSVAYRVFLINALALPTDEPDPDTYAHERDQPAPQQQPDQLDAARRRAWAATMNQASSDEARTKLWQDFHADNPNPTAADFNRQADAWLAAENLRPSHELPDLATQVMNETRNG